MSKQMISGWHYYRSWIDREVAELGKEQKFHCSSSESPAQALGSVVGDRDDIIERFGGDSTGIFIAPVICTVDRVKEETYGSGRYAECRIFVSGTLIRIGEFEFVSQAEFYNITSFTGGCCPFVPRGPVREFLGENPSVLKETPHDWPKVALLKALSKNRLDIAKLLVNRFWRKLKKLDRYDRKGLRKALFIALSDFGDESIDTFTWALEQWTRTICRDNCKWVKTLVETACLIGCQKFQKLLFWKFGGVGNFCMIRIEHLMRCLLCRETIDWETLNRIRIHTRLDLLPKWINRTVFKAHENNKEAVREWLSRF